MMSVYHNVQPKDAYLGKLSYGMDLLEELTTVCVKEEIHLGCVEALGAVQKARLGFYNQDSREYAFFEIEKALEITNLVGNVSLRDGKPMVHAHVTLTDSDGKAYGGHLALGTVVFACEFCITKLDGPEFVRGHDEETGLPLWEI